MCLLLASHFADFRHPDEWCRLLACFKNDLWQTAFQKTGSGESRSALKNASHGYRPLFVRAM
ncbi:hypothetical protein CEE69_30310 [Rhodopirellula bahusiensis]|uniref:Uncharacterized protein n=1 Tax=Rhodopirellula bahusiensis TaxID=2014065 RepID=A0A2G1VXS6_9BACT|nr:hypothetical protein CEE69_30310 [Rhodopirellula bahusiensis]